MIGLLLLFLWEKDAFVLCRIFEKSGSGPKNGEKYGAPFIEEEWDVDDVVVVPVPVADEPMVEVSSGEIDAVFETDDLEKVRVLFLIINDRCHHGHVIPADMYIVDIQGFAFPQGSSLLCQ